MRIAVFNRRACGTFDDRTGSHWVQGVPAAERLRDVYERLWPSGAAFDKKKNPLHFWRIDTYIPGTHSTALRGTHLEKGSKKYTVVYRSILFSK